MMRLLTLPAMYDYVPRSRFNENMVFGKKENGFPVIGVVDELGKVIRICIVGGTFRAFPAYKYTVDTDHLYSS